MDGGAWWAAVYGVAQSWTQLSTFTFTFHFHALEKEMANGNGNPLQCSCLENPRERGARWAAVYGVAQSRTRLKRQQQQQQCLELASKYHSVIKETRTPFQVWAGENRMQAWNILRGQKARKF